MKAIAAAYPDRTGAAEFREGDWAVPIIDPVTGERTWFFFAEARLLPENLRERWKDYDPQPFYFYPEELPPWKPFSREESARVREQDKRRRAATLKRSSHFFDALYRVHSKEDAWDHVKQIRFLGLTVMVHYSILEELSLVEERILTLSKTNAAVRQWAAGLKSAGGWNWRDIADTASRSFHAYGAAIDLLPKSMKGLETYWLWTSRSVPDWWTVPYTRRLHPPREVIKAFETLGFIWGGKWFAYDTMHFEYRPELLIYTRLSTPDP